MDKKDGVENDRLNNFFHPIISGILDRALYYNDTIYSSKRIKKLEYKWTKTSKKSVKTKFKWYKTRYYLIYKYKATKKTYKYVNGKCVKILTKKNYKYTKNIYKYIRFEDLSRYVLPSIDCESDNEQIIQLSNNIIKNESKKMGKPVSKLSDKEKANGILYWEQEHFIYDHYGNTRYGALGTLSVNGLNCVDSTHITVALLRAANIPAKYEAKSIDLIGGHCWIRAYLNGEWLIGEGTAHDQRIGFGECGWTNFWAKIEPIPGTHIDSYKYSKKYVQHGNLNEWMAINETCFIDGKWLSYYVLNGNADIAPLNYFK